MRATVSPLVTPALSAQREYWFIRASSMRKLKLSRSLRSAAASPYLRAHSDTARGRIRSGLPVACAVVSNARNQARAGVAAGSSL